MGLFRCKLEIRSVRILNSIVIDFELRSFISRSDAHKSRFYSTVAKSGAFCSRLACTPTSFFLVKHTNNKCNVYRFLCNINIQLLDLT